MPKAPTYTPRELEALHSASAIIARVHLNGEWHEQRFEPEGTEAGARDVLMRVQHALRHHRDFSSIVLYAEGKSANGEMMRACVPHTHIPEQLR